MAVLFVALLGPAPACRSRAAEDRVPEVAFYASASGLNVTLNMVFDFQGSGVLHGKANETVRLTQCESTNPWTAFVRGDFVVSGDDAGAATNGGHSTEAVTYGSYFLKNVLSNGTERTRTFFRQADAARAFGESDGTILGTRDGKDPEEIGRMALSKVVLPNGDQRTLTVSRLTAAPNAPWVLPLGDKVYSRGEDGKLTQIGWFGWRRVVLPGGKRSVLLMTRSMKTDGPWAGRQGSRLYLCPSQ